MSDSTALTTGEFSRRSGLSAKALRLYDDSGLLRPAFVDGGTGYRYYLPAQLERARLVALLRRVGMPLTDVAHLLAKASPDAEQRLRGWWAAREAEVVERRAVVEYLVHLLSAPEGAGSPHEPLGVLGPADGAAGAGTGFPVQVRTDPPLKLAVITSHVDQHELLGAINFSVIGLRRHVERSGATPGDEFHVLYRGIVSPDDDGQVEVCLPFSGTVEPTEEIGTRVEPSRELAFAPVTAEQCRYPRILRAYDAVGWWVQQHGTPVGSAREIYPTVRPGHAEDAACLVAQPFRRTR